MALTLNLAVLPVVAGLMAGTGAMAAYVVGPTSAPAAVSAPVEAAGPAKSCEAQTWPYIERRCVASAQKDRKVRLVMAPRDGESVTEIPVPAGAPIPTMSAPAATAPEQLVTRETVGRAVENAAPQAVPAPVSKRAEKRRARDERKLSRQAYQVPSETTGRRDTRPVIVVRPLRLDMFR